MKIYSNYQDLYSDLKTEKICLTIGNFDGVHQGHRYLLNNFVTYSLKRGLIPVVLTFSPHPFTYISGKNDHKIRTEEDNNHLIEELGIHHIYQLTFDEDLKKKNGKEFIEEILKTMDVSDLFLGHDFSLGTNKEFGPEDLVNNFKDQVHVFFERPYISHGKKISSSLIRSAMSHGEIQLVNEMLEQPYTIRGKVVSGNKVGTQLGFPTANIQYDKSLHLPKRGVYFARASIKGKTYRAAVNIGIRPSVTRDEKNTIEAHILNFSDDIYNQELELNFIEYIREEKKFLDKEKLIEQISEDINFVKNKEFELNFALIGKNIKHSRSPQIYSSLVNGFPTNYTLLNFNNETEIGELEKIVKTYKRVSVTSPYKSYCFKNSKSDSNKAKKLMAANTLKMFKTDLLSENTDYLACNDLAEKYDIGKFKNIFLLGDGVMADVIKLILDEKKVEFKQFSRKLKNISTIVDEINQLKELNKLMVINSCSRSYQFPKCKKQNYTFWDLNYSMPKHLKLFHSNNVNYIDGLDLLRLQAEYALSFWNCKSS